MTEPSPEKGNAGAGAHESASQPPASRVGKSGNGKKTPSAGAKTVVDGGKDRSDWNVFRTVVIAVGVVVIGFGAYALVTGTAGLPESSDQPINATLESQFRFFAAMMVGVGAAFVAIAIKFQWSNMLWLVCLMIFVGGIGRVLSWAFSGTPHFTLIILMVIELAFPAALVVWHAYIVKTSEIKQQYAQSR
ncbi:DUF4345 domain-containing protein [Arthrobacter roseus]|uniref:DUF4345 domain-containing protein n=1 Tax=Arthrobacter roseus TaxID=136274 RepID=UPI00196327A7|nr:DUF4345 domain-containing protein [Arthrobacter roseus]MBM7848218.1 cation transporter-like permease [Arthrobacter roseus]